MTSLDGCTADEIRELAEWTGRLKHDLGKYIRFRQAWLAADASLEQRREALIADVHHTRRGPDGSVSARAVWAEFRPILMGAAPLGATTVALDDARLTAIDAAMTELDALEPLATADEAAIARAERLCADVAGAIRTLAGDARSRFLGNG